MILLPLKKVLFFSFTLISFELMSIAPGFVAADSASPGSTDSVVAGSPAAQSLTPEPSLVVGTAGLPTCPTSGAVVFQCHWKTDGNTSEPSVKHYGSSRYCVGYDNTSNHAGSVTCSISKMTGTSRTATATVGGYNLVGYAALSASVSYTVNESTTMTGSYSEDTSPHTKGGINVKPTYDDVYKVKQEYVICSCPPRDCIETCKSQTGQNDYQYADTERYAGPYFLPYEN